MDNPLGLDSSGLRNRLHHSAKDDKENHSENEFEFEAPSLLSNHSDDDEPDLKATNKCSDSINLIDLNIELDNDVDLSEMKEKTAISTTNGENVKRKSNNHSNAKLEFGTDSNFRFNFQMPKIIQSPDKVRKVDEATETFLDKTVYTPSKRLQAENNGTDTTKHKKARLDETGCQPNWTFIKATFFITFIIAIIKIMFILWRNEYLI